MGAGDYMKVSASELITKSSFTTEEAKLSGLSPRMLSYYVEKGEIERIAKGVYRFSDYMAKDENIQWEELAVAAQRISNGVICLVSALNFYELTDEMMKEHWVAVPHSNPHTHFPMTRVVRMRNMTLGIQKKKIANIDVKIFDVERTIVDSFRLLDFETAMKALKLYLSGKCGKPNIKKLVQYSKELRADIKKYIAPLTI
jgi:predicted transcriptional regulator of viral defense system